MRISEITYKDIFNNFAYHNNGYLTWKSSPRYGINKGQRAGIDHEGGYRVIRFKRKAYKEHRLIWVLHHGFINGYIDHIDGDTRNNKIENLRICSHSQNHSNVSKRKNNKSGFKGVYKSGKSWAAKIVCNGSQHYLGSFKKREDAAEAYNFNALKMFGEFAKTNNIKGFVCQ